MGRTAKKRVVGYFNTLLSEDWSYSTWLGAMEAARARGVDLLSFHGAALRSDEGNEGQQNAIYDLALGGRIDGLVAWKGHLTRRLAEAETADFFHRYGVPVVTVEDGMEGFPRVTYGNREGARLLVDHLSEVHGIERIAFIGVVENHAGFMERYRGFVDAMRERGREVDPGSVFPHTYWEWSDRARTADEALDAWLRGMLDGGTEAIIGSCDPLALWAMNRLERIGASVPGDVAVVGYDAFQIGSLSSPSLTSVDPSWADLGAAAVNAVVDLLEGKEVPRVTVVEAKMVARRSCGCSEREVLGAGCPPASVPMRDEEMLAEMARAGGSGPGRPYADLLRSFRAVADGEDDSAFLSTLEGAVKATMRVEGDPSAWQSTIMILQRSAISTAGGSIERSLLACAKARALISAASRRAEGRLRLRSEKWQAMERELGLRLVTTFELGGLLDALADGLAELGLERCFLSLFEEPESYRYPDPAPEWSRLVLAVNGGGRRALPEGGLRFRSRELVPGGLLEDAEPMALAVASLHFGEEQIGFVLFDAGARERTIFDSLRIQLSSALKGVLLVDTIERQVADISRANERLEESYRDLRANQQRLLASETMASLGRLSAGIAHEMNTPLAALRSALKEIGTLADEYARSIGNAEVSEEDHREIAGDIAKNSELALRAAERSVGFIRGIKSQSSAAYGEEKREFDAGRLAEDALLVLEHLFKHGSCVVAKEIGAGLVLFGEQRAFGQIVTNLVTNAIDACGLRGGTVRISLSRDSEASVDLRVADDGCGISPENREKIFAPFFTTKPFGEGTGLGLSIVNDLVDKFGGTIDFESVPGNTVFHVAFPAGRS